MKNELNHVLFRRQKHINMTFELTSTEDFSTAIASGSEFFIVTAAAIDTISLWTELLINEGLVADGTQKACLMPMFILVRQILQKSKRKRIIFLKVFTATDISTECLGAVILFRRKYWFLWVPIYFFTSTHTFYVSNKQDFKVCFHKFLPII